ncbi:Hpt domain-containing protein [Massilia sp. B-10]|nr:Hpt domain-containing protein [Massilia sp. B-10]
MLEEAFEEPVLELAPPTAEVLPEPVLDAVADDEESSPVIEPELISMPESAAVAAEVAAIESALSDSAVQNAVAAIPFGDDLDADLLPVFLEEATDLLPELGNGLRKWQSNPSDVASAKGLLRILHTVKGSARMGEA